MIAGHLAALHSCCESMICLQGEGFRQDSLMEVIIHQREGKWGRGDVLNSPWPNSSVWSKDLLHCFCTPCTASRVHSLQWRMTTSPPDTLVWSLHLQADQTATDRVVTSLTWKQAGINTFGGESHFWTMSKRKTHIYFWWLPLLIWYFSLNWRLRPAVKIGL